MLRLHHALLRLYCTVLKAGAELCRVACKVVYVVDILVEQCVERRSNRTLDRCAAAADDSDSPGDLHEPFNNSAAEHRRRL